MPQAIQYLLKHPWILSILGTWVFNNVITVLVSSLPAPTKDASAKYVYWFKVLNTVIGNVKRAQIPRIEDSPNWQAAVDAHVQHLSSSGLIAAPPPKPPTAT